MLKVSYLWLEHANFSVLCPTCIALLSLICKKHMVGGRKDGRRRSHLYSKAKVPLFGPKTQRKNGWLVNHYSKPVKLPNHKSPIEVLQLFSAPKLWHIGLWSAILILASIILDSMTQAMIHFLLEAFIRRSNNTTMNLEHYWHMTRSHKRREHTAQHRESLSLAGKWVDDDSHWGSSNDIFVLLLSGQQWKWIIALEKYEWYSTHMAAIQKASLLNAASETLILFTMY